MLRLKESCCRASASVFSLQRVKSFPEAVKFFAAAGGYALDSQLRGQVNTAVGNFLKGSWIHDEFAGELREIPGAADLRYMRTGPDVISSSGTGLKYEITQLTPSLNAIYSHTRKYPVELLRYVTYR